MSDRARVQMTGDDGRRAAPAAPARPKSLWAERLLAEVLKPFSPAVRARSREPLFLRMLVEGLEQGGTLLEIGSSDGCEAVEAILRGGASRVVVAEPDPGNIAKAGEAIRRAGLPPVSVSFVNCAIGARSGRGEFYFHPTHSHLNGATPGRLDAAQAVTLDFFGLRDFVARQGVATPMLIKMDIEGYEVDVLDGAIDLLVETPGISILTELHPVLYTPERSMHRLLTTLFRNGYAASLVESAGERQPPEFAAAGLVPFLVSGTRGLYRDVPADLALEFCSAMHGTPPRKIARSLLLSRP